ncbi:MAG: response regulator, partial [Planctomycetota bacterium]|nr:response regulator [Planctomycetota bacterium]
MAYNFLLVDDSDVSRAIMAKTLEMSGLALGVIHQARHGLEALSILRSHWVDIVLADINMPVMGGVELVEKMKNDGMLQS